MLRVFENPQLNLKLNTLKKGDELYFKAKDVANALGYANTKKAIIDHVREDYKKCRSELRVTIRYPCSEHPQTVYITEPGLYQLIFSSQLPMAQQFQDWVFSEVLPQIRKTGTYEHKKDIRAMTSFKIENEYDLHKKVIDYIRRFHSHLLIVVGLGENQDTPQKRIQSWQKGYQKGQPDIIVQNAHKDYNGLCIELKTPKGTGEVSEAQNESLQRYEKQGYLTLISNDYDEIVHALKEYCHGLRVPCPRCIRRFKTEETLKPHLKWIHNIGYND